VTCFPLRCLALALALGSGSGSSGPGGPGLEQIAPARATASAPRVCTSLASSGIGLLRLAASHERSEAESRAIKPLLRLAGRAPLREGWWIDGWYYRNYSHQNSLLEGVVRVQREHHGRLNLASLRASSILGQGLLLGPDGRELTAADLPGLPCSSATVGDLIDVQWVRRRVVRFRLHQGTYPYAAASSFRTLCDLLVFNYPELLDRHSDPGHLVERSSGTDRWSLRCLDGVVALARTTATRQVQDLGIVQSISHAQQVARQATGRRRVHFAPHPLLSPVLPLWGSADLYSKRRLRTLVAKTSSRRAQAEQAARALRASELSPAFAAALESIDWAEVFNLPDSSSRQRLLFLKIKGLRLSGWDLSNGRRGCPHCADSGAAGGSTLHIVWDCPSARHLWAKVRSWWAALGLWPGATPAADQDFLSAVFSLRLPCTPPRVWAVASLSQSQATDETPEGPFPILQATWRQLVLETFVVIIGWRHSRYDPARAWSDAQAAAVHATSCQRVLATLARRRADDAHVPPAHVRLLSELQATFQRDSPDEIPLAPPAAADVHVLFFDGGSRGNPGPGGAGACVVRVDGQDGTAALVWSAAMSKAHRSTTNNQAEYHGLLAGLRAAAAHQWPNLEVVGDSAMILRQMRDYRPPRNAKLLRLYTQARRLADQLAVRHWTHHVRAHNKMADLLANLAMDTRTSSQVTHPTARSGHADLRAHLSNDLSPWLVDSVDRRAGLHVLR